MAARSLSGTPDLTGSEVMASQYIAEVWAVQATEHQKVLDVLQRSGTAAEEALFRYREDNAYWKTQYMSKVRNRRFFGGMDTLPQGGGGACLPFLKLWVLPPPPPLEGSG